MRATFLATSPNDWQRISLSLFTKRRALQNIQLEARLSSHMSPNTGLRPPLLALHDFKTSSSWDCTLSPVPRITSTHSLGLDFSPPFRHPGNFSKLPFVFLKLPPAIFCLTCLCVCSRKETFCISSVFPASWCPPSISSTSYTVSHTVGVQPVSELVNWHTSHKCLTKSLLCLVAKWCPILCNPRTAKLLCPCNSPSRNTGVGCHFLLQGIFLTQGSNPCLLYCRQILLQLIHKVKPY